MVNGDGTMSRIANWDQLSEREQEATRRRITKRNAERKKDDILLDGPLLQRPIK